MEARYRHRLECHAYGIEELRHNAHEHRALLDSFAVSDVGLLALMTEAEAERMPLDEAEQILLGAPGYPWLFISVPF